MLQGFYYIIILLLHIIRIDGVYVDESCPLLPSQESGCVKSTTKNYII